MELGLPDSHSGSPSPSASPSVNPGSALASLWIKTSQDHNPPASVPSTSAPLMQCPRCGGHLTPSFQQSIYQLCNGCGWQSQDASGQPSIA